MVMNLIEEPESNSATTLELNDETLTNKDEAPEFFFLFLREK